MLFFVFSFSDVFVFESFQRHISQYSVSEPKLLRFSHKTRNQMIFIQLFFFVFVVGQMKLMFASRLDRPSPAGEDGVIEGVLTRKHEWESTTKKASNRSWDKVINLV